MSLNYLPTRDKRLPTPDRPHWGPPVPLFEKLMFILYASMPSPLALGARVRQGYTTRPGTPSMRARS